MVFYLVLCNYIVVISWWMNSAACKLYIGCISVVFIRCSAVECFNCNWPLYSVLLTVGVRTVCLKVEQNNPKQNNWAWLKGLLTIREVKLVGQKVAKSFGAQAETSVEYGKGPCCAKLPNDLEQLQPWLPVWNLHCGEDCDKVYAL